MWGCSRLDMAQPSLIDHVYAFGIVLSGFVLGEQAANSWSQWLLPMMAATAASSFSWAPSSVCVSLKTRIRQLCWSTLLAIRCWPSVLHLLADDSGGLRFARHIGHDVTHDESSQGGRTVHIAYAEQAQLDDHRTQNLLVKLSFPAALFWMRLTLAMLWSVYPDKLVAVTWLAMNQGLAPGWPLCPGDLRLLCCLWLPFDITTRSSYQGPPGRHRASANVCNNK